VTDLFPPLLRNASSRDRDVWARWVLNSHSDQFLPEMHDFVLALDREDPVAIGSLANPSFEIRDDLLVVTCRAGEHCIVLDQPLQCKVILFDWTGKGVHQNLNPFNWPVISRGTESKGEIIEYVCGEVGLPGDEYYFAVLDDDLCLKASDINLMLSLSRIHRLTASQPALSLESSTSREYPWLHYQSGFSLHRVPIVEIQAPFIRCDLMRLSLPFIRDTKSAYGFDRFVLPACAYHLGLWRFAVIDRALMSHIRPLASVSRSYTNGLTSKQEELLVRHRLMRAIGFDTDFQTYHNLEQALRE